MVNRIQSLCKERNITLNRLEIEIGLSKSSISKWDTNAPSIDKVEKVATYFGVSLDYLIGRKEKGTDAFVVDLSKVYFALSEEMQDLTEQQKKLLLTLLKRF